MGGLRRRRDGAAHDERGFRRIGELLPVEAIDPSGLLVTSQGAFLRMIDVTPPNTLLLSVEERQHIAAGYSQLISRLRPGQWLQFYVESRPVDIEQILADSRREVEAAVGPMPEGATPASPEALSRWRLYAAMEESIRLHATDQAAVEMQALVIVPYLPGQYSTRNLLRSLRLGDRTPIAALERGLRDHRRAVQESLAHTEMIRSELDALRLSTRTLNGEQIAELLWARFNPTSASGRRRRAITSEVLVELDTPRAAAEARLAAKRLREALGRSSIDFERSQKYVEVDRDVEQALSATTTADGTYLGALMGAMLTREPFALSVFVHALDRKTERGRLKRSYRRVFAVNRGAEAKGRVPDFDRYAQEQESEQLLAEMAGESRANIFRVAYYQAIRVPGPEADLQRLAEAVDHCADEVELSTDCRVNRGEFRQEPFWLSTLPLGRDAGGAGRRYVTRNAGDLVPLVGTTCGSPDGIPFAFAEPMRTLERLDPWDRTHSNFLGVLAGRSGSGKTVCANVILSRCIAQGAQGFVIDRAGHYGVLADLVAGAQEIDLGSGEARFAINPWDVDDPASVSLDKISFLLSLHAVMMGSEGLTVLERSQLAAAIRGVYLRASIEDLVPREWLLREELLLRAEEESGAGSVELASMLRNLAERLGEYCGDGVYAYLADRETTVEADAPLVVFDTRRCPEEVIGPQMFSIVEFIQRRIERQVARETGEGDARWANRSVLLVDEAWHLLRRKETGAYANDLARRSRHLGLFLLVSSQQLSDFNTEEGIALVRNSTMQFLLNQQADEVPFIRDAINLSDEEASLLTRLGTVKGSHSEIFWANGVRGRGKVSLRLGPLEYWAFSSDPIRDAPLRGKRIAELEGDAWTAIHELARTVDPTEAPEREPRAA